MRDKQRRALFLTGHEDASMILKGSVVDFNTAMAVQEIDAADDHHRLAEHSEMEMGHRVTTSREEAAYGLPPGCFVIVKRGPAGSQIRMVFPPQ